MVLEANKKTIEWIRPGVTHGEFKEYGRQILIQGAKKLGLIKEDDEIIKYYYLFHLLHLEKTHLGLILYQEVHNT